MTGQLRRAALDVALLSMAERGQRPICSTDSAKWISDDAAMRDSAAADCSGCPVIEPCRASGADELAGVWGGVDLTPRRGRPKPVALAVTEVTP